MHLKLLKKAIQRAAERASDLIGNTVADKITKVSKPLPQNNSETAKKNNIRLY